VFVDLSESNPHLTKGGIHLPENAAIELQPSGRVVSVGPGVMTAMGWDQPQVKVGDIVKFERSNRSPWVDKENYVVSVWAGDIIGVQREADIVRNRKPLTEAVR
jgi:co-chaperonin GroES (HSP10)